MNPFVGWSFLVARMAEVSPPDLPRQANGGGITLLTIIVGAPFIGGLAEQAPQGRRLPGGLFGAANPLRIEPPSQIAETLVTRSIPHKELAHDFGFGFDNLPVVGLLTASRHIDIAIGRLGRHRLALA